MMNLDDPKLLEKLADIEHARWSGWERYREQCVAAVKRPGDTETHEERWRRLRETPYAELTEASKESDRVEARKTLDAIREHVSLRRGPFKVERQYVSYSIEIEKEDLLAILNVDEETDYADTLARDIQVLTNAEDIEYDTRLGSFVFFRLQACDDTPTEIDRVVDVIVKRLKKIKGES